MLSKPFALFNLTKKWHRCSITHSFLKKFRFNPIYVNTAVYLINHDKLYCTQSDRDNTSTASRQLSKDWKKMIQDKKRQFKVTEEKIKEKGTFILQDIKVTRDKVKGKVEEIVERENIYTIPNFLCIVRMALSPYIGYLIVQSQFNGALIILIIASVTDLFDGWIARTWTSQSSKMGSFLDPMADKILVGTLFLSLTYVDLIPLALTALIIARDAILVASGFIIRYMSLPPPRTLSRYFDVTHATVQLAPTFISKVNTGVQLMLVGSTLAAPVFHYVGHPILESLWYVTGATTIASALSYILSKNTYKMLKKSDIPKNR